MTQEVQTRTAFQIARRLPSLAAPWIIAGVFATSGSRLLADSAGAKGAPVPPVAAGDQSGSRWPTRAARTGSAELSNRTWWSMMGLTLGLAVCGGVYAACRRLVPRHASGSVKIVGRMSLSPKHAVYVLQVGRRVLLVGTGPQGAPSLITELDDLADVEPIPVQGGVS